ncbi:MAG: hypothetical protein LBU70_09595 [Chitinispirillales bacterium]|jgi:hypothetical protein|nr:hypothetical protein [Chitinispirillales bacterium]
MSFTKKIKTLAVVLAVAATASAQFNGVDNARTRALNGAPLGDISDIHSYPVLMMEYLNQAQITWNGTDEAPAGGSIIATKSLLDGMLGLGIITNRMSMADARFQSTVGTELSGINPPVVPHILIGANLGMLKAGLDLFIEHNGYSATVSTSNADNSVSTNDTTNSAMLFGTRLSANADLGMMDLLVKFGIGFPSLNRKATGPSAGGGIETTEEKLKSGLYLEIGAEVSSNIAGIVDLTIGGGYTSMSHQLADQVTPASTTVRPVNTSSLLSIYLSAEANVLETVAAVVGYEIINDVSKTLSSATAGTPPVTTETTARSGTFIHAFFAGLEGSWDNVWWKFDNLKLRSGINYTIATPTSKTSNNQNSAGHERSEFATHAFADPTIGIGVSKGLLTIDAALNFGRLIENEDSDVFWENRGLLNGPTFGSVSATFRF